MLNKEYFQYLKRHRKNFIKNVSNCSKDIPRQIWYFYTSFYAMHISYDIFIVIDCKKRIFQILNYNNLTT